MLMTGEYSTVGSVVSKFSFAQQKIFKKSARQVQVPKANFYALKSEKKILEYPSMKFYYCEKS